MKIYFHEKFYGVYTADPAAASGRMEAITEALDGHYELITFDAALEEDILAIHPKAHVASIFRKGLYDIAALAAGGALQAAKSALTEPSFAVIRPPGHHASADSCWGFCYFNNMAISLAHLFNHGHINSAFLLDFDLHYGDGNVNILGGHQRIDILNPEDPDRRQYMAEVEHVLGACSADMIAVSAGFDNHIDDWGGVLLTEDYHQIGKWVSAAARRNNGGCFGILEGGYNHDVLGENVLAFIQGMDGDA